MYDCFIIGRSITSAQRLSRTLSRAGYRAEVQKLPSGIAGAGCGYVVRVAGSQIIAILKYLKSMEYGPVRVLCEFENGRVEEYR